MFSLIQKPNFYLSTYSFVFKDQVSDFIMEALKVNSCMCLDLRTGGFVIGSIQLIAHCILFIYGFKFLTIPENIVIFALGLVVGLSWVHGIRTHNRNYMFPFVGLMKLSFISCFLIAIGVSIAIVINPLSNELQGAWIVSIMGTVFFWYFAAVMYSLYKSMKVTTDNNQPHMVSEMNNEHAMSENVV